MNLLLLLFECYFLFETITLFFFLLLIEITSYKNKKLHIINIFNEYCLCSFRLNSKRK